jgi:rhodanese-related sulfurtransferase
MPIQPIRNQELKGLLASGESFCLLDVRTAEEYGVLGHIPGAVLIPIDQLMGRIGELDPANKTVVICQHGIRSFHVSLYLDHLGFQEVLNHESGMADWDGALEFGKPVLPDHDNPHAGRVLDPSKPLSRLKDFFDHA